MRRFMMAALALSMASSPAAAVDLPYNYNKVLYNITRGLDSAENIRENCEFSAKKCAQLYNQQRREVNEYIRQVAFDPSLDRRTQLAVWKVLRQIVAGYEDCDSAAACKSANMVLIRKIVAIIHDQDPLPPVSV